MLPGLFICVLGENPFQYIFAGAPSTASIMHNDPGGMGIFIAPICGKKELTLIHRNDASRLYEMAPWDIDGGELNFQKYPMLQFVRVWRHVLEPGDVAYLPAGTYHSVKNLESCLSYHRFHLDEVNLPLFFNSLYAGDAPEIDHYEVIWNSIHGIFNDLENLEDIDMNRNKLNSNNLANDGALKIVEKRLSKLRLLLIRLRQICCAIYDQEHKKEWRDIMEDIDSVLCRGENSKYSSDESGSSLRESHSEKITRNVVNAKFQSSTSVISKVKNKMVGTEKSFSKEGSRTEGSKRNVGISLAIGKTLIIKRFGTQRKCQVIGVRRGVASWKCTYKGWHSVYDEYVPIENIKSQGVKRDELKKNDKVLVQWGESGDVYEARLLKFYEGVMINLSFSDLGHDWNTWVPEHLLEENETSGELQLLL